MKKYLNILKQCRIFSSIGEEDLLRMLTCFGAKIETFDKKYTIFAEGTQAKYMGILLSGEAQTVQFDYYGNKSILSNIAPGEMFAEAFACAAVDSLPVAVIATEQSDVMFVPCDHILHTCNNQCGFHQQLIYNLVKELAEKTIRFHQKVEVTGKRTTREKLLTYLSLESKRAQSTVVEIPFDRQELADYLEVDRSGLSAEISKLKKEGLIDCKKNRFELL
ncbi:MAG: Crp/Fnr family transcriptional regulator [Ruminococcaceae bacterium]|nr:Crp/Fnr family transcriptional regulator [Oscillospiraceae bacterium]